MVVFHQLSSQKKRFFDHHHERGKKYTNERKKKKKKEESKFFKKRVSLSRESERERGRLVARQARPRRDDDEKEELLSRFVLSPRVSFFCEESRLLGVSKAFESRLLAKGLTFFFSLALD